MKKRSFAAVATVLLTLLLTLSTTTCNLKKDGACITDPDAAGAGGAAEMPVVGAVGLFPNVPQAPAYVTTCYYAYNPPPSCLCSERQDERVYTCAPLLSEALGPDTTEAAQKLHDLVANSFGGSDIFVRCYPTSFHVGKLHFWMPCQGNPPQPPPGLPPATGIKVPKFRRGPKAGDVLTPALRIDLGNHPVDLVEVALDEASFGVDDVEDVGDGPDPVEVPLDLDGGSVLDLDGGAAFDASLPSDLGAAADPVPSWTCGSLSNSPACATQCDGSAAPPATCTWAANDPTVATCTACIAANCCSQLAAAEKANPVQADTVKDCWVDTTAAYVNMTSAPACLPPRPWVPDVSNEAACMLVQCGTVCKEPQG